MKTNAQFVFKAVCLVNLTSLLPIDMMAGRQASGQRAGEVSRLIPAVTITRGTSSLNASEKTAVDWQDIINTQANARARVTLDDGSLLNVGSEAVLQVVKHDAGAQQTALELVSGKMRVQARKLTLPGAKFEVKTPTGIAGVVGTDFYIGYDDNLMTVMVFEGKVKVCNLMGVCVEVFAGMMTTVRNGDVTGPAKPTQTSQSMVAEGANTTSLEAGLAKAALGLVGKSISAHVGNSEATEAETVYSGDSISTDARGTLLVLIGSLTLQLESNSSAHVFKAPYGAVVELTRGAALYGTRGGQQNLVIVASDVRVTPFTGTAALGRVNVDDPCKISVFSQKGQAAVQVGSETKTVEQGKAFKISAEYSTNAQDSHPPDADDYHSSHYHRPCSAAQGTGTHRPVPAGQSRFVYFATGAVAVATVVPVVKALESPNRP